MSMVLRKGGVPDARPHLDTADELENCAPSVSVEVGSVTLAAVVRYHTTCASAECNQRLIENLLAELAARDPGGLCYLAFRFDEGLGFMHVAIFDGTADPFSRCAGYQEFHRELGRRLAAPPAVMRAVLIGSYRPQIDPGAHDRR